MKVATKVRYINMLNEFSFLLLEIPMMLTSSQYRFQNLQMIGRSCGTLSEAN